MLAFGQIFSYPYYHMDVIWHNTELPNLYRLVDSRDFPYLLIADSPSELSQLNVDTRS